MTGHIYDPKRILVLSHEIDDKTVFYYIKKILKFNAEDREREIEDPTEPVSPILLVINSFGGSIYDGLALIGVIESSITPIHTVSLGSCMSMGLYIFITGHVRYMNKYSTLMYHEGSTYIEGNIGNLKNESKEMERIEKVLDDMLIKKSNVTQKIMKLRTKDKENWYINSSTAYRLKITDHVI